MHEYHKAVEWADKAIKLAKERNAEKIKALNVTIGESSGYSPEVVKNYFDEAVEGTIAEGAEFHVNVTRTLLRCPVCGKLFRKQLLQYECPDCGIEGEMTESGNEVEFDGIEI